jgi:hypothetical protein
MNIYAHIYLINYYVVTASIPETHPLEGVATQEILRKHGPDIIEEGVESGPSRLPCWEEPSTHPLKSASVNTPVDVSL